MRRVAFLVLAALLAGCTDQLAARQAYFGQFVGQPDSVLVQQMGVPTRTYETSGVKYLAYDEHRIDVLPGPPAFGPPFYRWYGGGFPAQVIDLRCETTFEVAGGMATVQVQLRRTPGCSSLVSRRRHGAPDGIL